MWALNFLPDVVFHLVLIVGILAIIVSYVLAYLPFVQKYKLPLQVGGIILTVIGIWYEGGIAKDKEYRVKIADMQIQVAKAEKASAELNTKLVEELLKNEQVIRDNNNANKKKLKELEANLNAGCKVQPQVIDVLNNAAVNIK
jgi:hypothetical protein